MGWMDTGIAKTRAVASDARADLAEVDSKISGAQAWLKVTEAGDTAARGLAGSWLGRQAVLAPVFGAAAAQTGALHSRAVATVDDLTAKREAARSRLSFAEKSNNAMTRIAQESDKILGD